MSQIEIKIGADNMKVMLDFIRSGNINDQQLKDIAHHLGINSKGCNIVFGKHKTRMERDRYREKHHEMRAILSDWWDEELHQMSSMEALEKLIKTFGNRDIDCQPLAYMLKVKS